MNPVDTPSELFDQLVDLFPGFRAELEGEELESYHQVVMRLTPLVSGYLERSPQRTVKKFAELVNLMADSGGARENAISTCFLEHASQIGVRNLIRPHLGEAAKKELR